jgi:uncharacterized protein YdhG (YjbR/CyaY superfamily)
MEKSVSFKNVDEYINTFPVDVQVKLKSIRKAILSVIPDSLETIKYQMPTYQIVKKGGKYTNLVHFAAYKNHIGFYPTPSPIEKFADELAGYQMSKGAIRFPIDEPLPLDLIKRIVKNRVEIEVG